MRHFVFNFNSKIIALIVITPNILNTCKRLIYGLQSKKRVRLLTLPYLHQEKLEAKKYSFFAEKYIYLVTVCRYWKTNTS